jgi:hypothetical protein
MATGALSLARWLADSRVPQATLTAAQHAVLQAAFHFLQHSGRDYFARRLLSHVLLHAGTGLKVAQIARLLGFSRSAASAQQGLSAKEVVQATHHRLAGRSHGKLLPRFAGPIAHFLHERPQATRWDLLDFIQATFGVSLSRMALHRFLKKYGLDQARRPGTPPTPVPAATPPPPPPGVPVPLPPQDFFLPPPGMPAPSCCSPPPSTGSPAPGTASRTSTAR